MSLNHVKKIVLRFRESALKKLFLYGNQFDPANNYCTCKTLAKSKPYAKFFSIQLRNLYGAESSNPINQILISSQTTKPWEKEVKNLVILSP